MAVRTKTWLFRIVHIENLEYILKNGIHNRHHPDADPNYINIGDSNLIEKRNEYPVGVVPPGGALGEYVPFYLGPLSPMLLNIKTGYRGITQRSQADIIYICCKIEDVVSNCQDWCYTNGHAKIAFTKFYNNLEQLDDVDWNMVMARYWMPTEEDYDRMRRKQAEFLVKDYVPVHCINRLVVYNDAVKVTVARTVENLRLDIPVFTNPNNDFYY